MSKTLDERMIELADKRQKIIEDIDAKLEEISEQIYYAARNSLPDELLQVFDMHHEYFSTTQHVRCGICGLEVVIPKHLPTVRGEGIYIADKLEMFQFYYKLIEMKRKL